MSHATMQKYLITAIQVEIVCLILIWIGGCVSNKPLPCDWTCPNGGRIPEDCYCKGNVLDELRGEL